jgi:hypothetical protein
VIPDDDWWTPSRVGTQVVLAGRLVSVFGAFTHAKCSFDRPCCNTETPYLTVLTGHGRVSLTSAVKPHAFRCVGDQTGHCCPFAPFGDVLVRGTVSAPFRGYFNYEVSEPEICSVVATARHGTRQSRQGEER